MATSRETMKQDLENVRTGLRGLRDEIKVKLHLATMDAKDEWKKLEPKLAEAEQMVEAVSDAALLAAREVEKQARALRDRLHALHEQQKVAHR